MRFEWPDVIEQPRAFWGMGRIIVRWSRDRAFPAPPRGWRHLKLEYRNAVYELPVWLYWPVRLWEERYWRVCEPLCAWGVFRVKEEGGFYKEGRFCLPPWLYRLWWCFRHDTDTAPQRREYWGPPRRRPTREQIERAYAILDRGKVA